MFTNVTGRLPALRQCTPRNAFVRFISQKKEADPFSELKDTAASAPKNASTIFNFDALIANSPDLRDTQRSLGKYDEYAFGNSVKDPREAAKAINISGPSAGRTVDVTFQNVGTALRGVQSILRQNDIRSQWHNQKRYIRPAKFRKMKKSLWWKKHFALGFSDLMSQITDAKRRGY
ncbi:hypothetical protein METBIDRAFT_31743 [Metschnikowia bicuspidata var. bicuspidata NRRL YB-4993]|uniref:Ribosomal protein S21 n=1 Tax=Metschnikowia bicuspidata var. bicuspidata NRRL YB-4993 TaxID=869754 RepID=A0A1A0HAI7_9ASCO|nr:hypothetical protein METBIDRAFT_31743 [Metschnikowia bicuspidata var. bicuspidata NRRL YB-4993]OBA21144.1 hypothetical protein METBIDRAFT_31743 [Metschnikowia bicuspidata var. bicuspidata NRRL YB-4993]